MVKKTLEEVEQEIYAKRKTVRYDVRDLTVEAISNKYEQSLFDDDEKKAYNYIYIPEYQRDFTWDEDRKSKLIESIVLGLPIPFIFVAENKNGSWEVVDGSQRIRTIHAFLKDKFELQNLNSISSLNGYKYSELDETRKGKFLNTALRLIVLSEETTNDVKTDMFERINRGSDLLKPMERRKGSFKGLFTDFLYEYCLNSDSFKRNVQLDKWLINRQEREELLLRFFALSEKKAYETGLRVGISDYLDEYLQIKNDEWANLDENALRTEKDKCIHRIDAVTTYVEKNFPYGYRHADNPQTKRSVFEAISVGVDKAIEEKSIKEKLDKEDVENLLKSNEFRAYTHVVNQLHSKVKLNGRIMMIYDFVVEKR